MNSTEGRAGGAGGASPKRGLRNVVGVPVHGPDFFDREAERAAIWRSLATNHVLIPSPRRVGKTSLMRTLAAEANAVPTGAAAVSAGASTGAGAAEPTGGAQFAGALYVDVAGAADEREFVARLCTALEAVPAAQRVARGLRPGALGRLLGRIQSISAGAVGLGLRAEREKTWKELGNAFVAALRQDGRGWLILCDELGIFVQTLLRREGGDAARARAFLTWLRDDVRQSAGAPDSVRWVVASSIGLPTLTDLNRIGDTINDFELVPVGAFSDNVADLFLAELARGRGVQLDAAVRRRVIARVGWPIPYFLQVFFAALVEQRPAGTVIAAEEVDAAFERLLGIEYRTYFDWWTQRLVEELGRQRGHHARILLTAAAQRPEGVRATTLRTLLAEHATPSADLEWAQGPLFDILENDGYWVRDDLRYRFRSNLLRAYWLRRHAR